MNKEELRNEINSLDEQIQFLQSTRLELLLQYQKDISEIVVNDILENITLINKKFVFVEYKAVANQVVMLLRRYKKGEPLDSFEIHGLSDTWKKTGHYKEQ